MAFAELIMEDKNNRVRKAPVGFSWTVLFFGPFVPLLRGDWLYFLIIALLMIIFPFSIYYIDLRELDKILIDIFYEEQFDYFETEAVVFLSFTFCSFLQLIFSFIYNRIYIQNFIESFISLEEQVKNN